jgi:hypothetical protein
MDRNASGVAWRNALLLVLFTSSPNFVPSLVRHTSRSVAKKIEVAAQQYVTGD